MHTAEATSLFSDQLLRLEQLEEVFDFIKRGY